MQGVQPTKYEGQQGALSKDWFLVGSAAGSIATIARGMLDYLLYMAGASDVRFPDIAGGAVLGLKNGRPRTAAEEGIGYVADAAFGGLFGATMALLLSNTPTRHRVLKGGMFGVGLWAATFSFGALLKIDGLVNPSPKSTAASFISTTVYGSLVGYLIDLVDRRSAVTSQDQAATANQNQGQLQNSSNVQDKNSTQDGKSPRFVGSPLT